MKGVFCRWKAAKIDVTVKYLKRIFSKAILVYLTPIVMKLTQYLEFIVNLNHDMFSICVDPKRINIDVFLTALLLLLY